MTDQLRVVKDLNNETFLVSSKLDIPPVINNIPANWKIRAVDENIPIGLSVHDSKTNEKLFDANFREVGNGIWAVDFPIEGNDGGTETHYFLFDYIPLPEKNPNKESTKYFPERIHLGTMQNFHDLES